MYSRGIARSRRPAPPRPAVGHSINSRLTQSKSWAGYDRTLCENRGQKKVLDRGYLHSTQQHHGAIALREYPGLCRRLRVTTVRRAGGLLGRADGGSRSTDGCMPKKSPRRGEARGGEEEMAVAPRRTSRGGRRTSPSPFNVRLFVPGRYSTAVVGTAIGAIGLRQTVDPSGRHQVAPHGGHAMERLERGAANLTAHWCCSRDGPRDAGRHSGGGGGGGTG